MFVSLKRERHLKSKVSKRKYVKTRAVKREYCLSSCIDMPMNSGNLFDEIQHETCISYPLTAEQPSDQADSTNTMWSFSNGYMTKKLPSAKDTSRPTPYTTIKPDKRAVNNANTSSTSSSSQTTDDTKEAYVPTKQPHHPDYSDSETRLNTFDGWPRQLPSKTQLCNVGFFFTGMEVLL